MHLYITYAAFGWLAFSGAMHFVIDVVLQYLRGQRVPGPETTLYYGLNTSYALGQLVFGLLCLWLAWRDPSILKKRAVVALCFAAAVGWLGIALGFMDYWEPKVVAVVFVVLVITMAVAATRTTSLGHS